MHSIAETHSTGYGSARRGYAPPRDCFEVEARTAHGVYVPRLYAAGDERLVDAPAVAVVGSRAASPAGRAFAAEVACALVKAGFAVMSGLALGIDTAVHRAAIAAGGRTIAVIGTPLDRAYPPENASLQRQIWEEHLLVSPFRSGTRTHRGHFPARNRVMGRLALATVIAEAGENSGTVHQVREALACGHRVIARRALVDACPWLHALAAHTCFATVDDAPAVAVTARRLH